MAKTGSYRSGQTVDIDIIFAQNHLGRLEMRICPLDAKSEKDCKSMQRADGKVGRQRGICCRTRAGTPGDRTGQHRAIFVAGSSSASRSCLVAAVLPVVRGRTGH